RVARSRSSSEAKATSGTSSKMHLINSDTVINDATGLVAVAEYVIGSIGVRVENACLHPAGALNLHKDTIIAGLRQAVGKRDLGRQAISLRCHRVPRVRASERQRRHG